MNNLGFWGLSIALAFVAGSIVTGTVVFGDEVITKLQKQCTKELKDPKKIKPDCELLDLFFGLQTQVDDLEERVAALENPPPTPKMTVFVDDQEVTTLVGAQIVKVVISDPNLADTHEQKGEPDVTVNGDALRMVQQTSGNWFGYFSDTTSALIADSQVVTPGTGSDFGVFCSSNSGSVLGSNVIVDDTNGFAIQDPALVTGEVNGNPDGIQLSNLCTDPVPNATPDDLMSVLDAGNITPAFPLPHGPLQGQIGVNDGFWPFIQLYTFEIPPVNIVYNTGGEAPEKIILTFVSVP